MKEILKEIENIEKVADLKTKVLLQMLKAKVIKMIVEEETLIQEERKEAVRGFVDKIRNEMGGKQFGTNPKDEKKEEAMHISYNWAISDMVRLLETYLQSLDKGGE